MTRMTREVDELLAMCGELLDEELLDKVRALRVTAVEADAVDERFRAAMDEVRQALVGRMKPRLVTGPALGGPMFEVVAEIVIDVEEDGYTHG